MKFGYARVSTQDQNLQSQIDILEQYGVDEIQTDKMSGRKGSRPGLDYIMDHIRPEDALVVTKLNRAGRSVIELAKLFEVLQEKGATFISIQDGIDTGKSMGKVFYHLAAVFAEVEADNIREATMRGLESARARGRVGGRPSVPQEKIDAVTQLREEKGYTVKEACASIGVNENTYYARIKAKGE